MADNAGELYEGAVAAMQEFGRACDYGSNDNRAQKAARLGSYLLALHALAARAERAEAAEPAAPVAIKGAWIDGGYVIVTPAKGQDPKALKAAILALGERAEAAQRVPLTEETEFEVWQDDELQASALGPRAYAWQEALRYAAQYAKDGVVRVFEVSRREVGITATEPKGAPHAQE